MRPKRCFFGRSLFFFLVRSRVLKDLFPIYLKMRLLTFLGSPTAQKEEMGDRSFAFLVFPFRFLFSLTKKIFTFVTGAKKNRCLFEFKWFWNKKNFCSIISCVKTSIEKSRHKEGQLFSSFLGFVILIQL